jgi:hypothetical protein
MAQYTGIRISKENGWAMAHFKLQMKSKGSEELAEEGGTCQSRHMYFQQLIAKGHVKKR